MRKIKTDRSLVMYILLTILTCGIYAYYFIYKLADDVNEMCEGDGQKTGGLLAYIVFSFLTCGFYSLYWEYKIGNRLQANAPKYGITLQENGTTLVVWYLVGSILCGIGPFVAMHILLKNTNQLAMAYNLRAEAPVAPTSPVTPEAGAEHKPVGGALPPRDNNNDDYSNNFNQFKNMK